MLLSSIGPVSAQYKNNSETDSIYGALLTVILLSITIAALFVRKGQKRERKCFAAEVKRDVLKKQRHKCARCKWKAGLFDFDHLDGNRSNNKLSNCVALCPNCHAKKTRGLIVISKKSKGPIKVIIFLFIFLLLIAFIFSNAPK